MLLDLDPLQRDALSEILNIGVGKSAQAMSQLVGEEVLLSVPEISFMTVGQAGAKLSRDDKRMYSVRQSFKGVFGGDALLIFPEDGSRALVRSMGGDAVAEEQLDEVMRDAMTEVGNIILNACMAALAELFAQPFETQSPQLQVDTARRIIGARAQNHAVMFIHIRFVLHESNTEGFVIFIMNTTSLEDFKAAIRRFVGDAMPPGPAVH